MYIERTRMDQILFTMLLGLASAFFVVSIIIFPDKAFHASLQGLTIWWNIIFPGLLPFLILSEVLLAFGVLHLLGVLLEPMMRLVFKLPGISGPVLAIGCTIGFPIGAKLTSQLREQGLISRNEGENLLAISHLSSPVLIMNVIAVGFFHNVQLGLFLIMIQFISLIIMGIILRQLNSSIVYETKFSSQYQYTLFKRAYTSMQEAHLKDNRSFGKLLGNAVNSSIQTLLMIGGYIMIFSVLIEISRLSHVTNIFYTLFNNVLPESISHPFLIGIFEVHLGTYAISQTAINWNIALIGFLLAWSGISLHLQVKSIISKTDLRYSKFLVARLIHALLALWFSFWLWKPFNRLLHHVKPSFLQLSDAIVGNQPIKEYFDVWSIWGWSALIILLIMAAMICLSLLIATLKKI